MSRYSQHHKGQVLDWKFKGTNGRYTFYLRSSYGDAEVGQIFKGFREDWSVVTCNNIIEGLDCHELFLRVLPVDGFKTRTDAAQFLLKLGGWVKREPVFEVDLNYKLKLVPRVGEKFFPWNKPQESHED